LASRRAVSAVGGSGVDPPGPVVVTLLGADGGLVATVVDANTVKVWAVSAASSPQTTWACSATTVAASVLRDTV
jgi:hypothetical protein